jgi:membrane protease YdiL (CAAX protease family)
MVGAVLCGLYLRTGTLRTPIAAHVLNNLIAVLVMFLRGSGTVERNNLPDPVSQLLIGGVMLLATGWILVRFLRRTWPREGTVMPYHRA